jgi:hypothetical protein
MSSSWSTVFKRAVEIEAEGAKDFEDILGPKASGKRKLSEEEVVITQPAESNGAEGKDDHEEFRQPAKLFQFVNSSTVRLDGTDSNTEEADTPSEPVIEKEERNMVEVCGKQVCRSWLKYHFLKLGNPCPSTCLRKHEITCKPEHLYKDYSFKGLSPKQRKEILQQLKA